MLWANSRGVFHCDLGVDNFVIKGDSLDDIKKQGFKPKVTLIDFGASIISPAVYDAPDPNSFSAVYENQWHNAATHGRVESADPYAVSYFRTLRRAQ